VVVNIGSRQEVASPYGRECDLACRQPETGRTTYETSAGTARDASVGSRHVPINARAAIPHSTES